MKGMIAVLRLVLRFVLCMTTINGIKLVAETLSSRRFDGFLGYVPTVITVLLAITRIFLIWFIMNTMVDKVKIIKKEREKVYARVSSKEVLEDKHCFTLEYQRCFRTFSDQELFNKISKGDYVRVILKRKYFNNGHVKYVMKLY